LRSTDEQLRRFSLILLAKDIIENPSAAIFHDKSIINIRAANFWTLSMRHEDGIIKVIIFNDFLICENPKIWRFRKILLSYRYQ
jgi:hypothetical protein